MNSTIGRLLIAVAALASVIIAVGAMADEPAAADGEKKAEQPAARKATGKVVVFPLEGVNVETRVLDASTEILSSAMVSAGFTVADWKMGFRKVTGEDPDMPPPPPAVEKPSVLVAPMPAELSDPPEPTTAEAGATPAGESEDGVAEKAGDSAPLPKYTRITVSARPRPQVRRGNHNGRPAQPVQMKLKLSSEIKAEIARELGCDYYFDGKLVLLGSRIRVTVEKHNLQGDAVDAKVMEAKGEDELITVYEWMGVAFADNRRVEDFIHKENAQRGEALRQSTRFKLQNNFGIIMGESFSVSDNMDHYTMLAFDARIEMKDLMIILNAGFGVSGGDDPSGHFLAGVGIGYYLTHTSVAPYLGAGFGIFAGDRVMENKTSSSSSQWNADDEDGENVAVGFEIYPSVGLEFLRFASIRVHLECRYNFSVVTDRDFGHGISALIGINF